MADSHIERLFAQAVILGGSPCSGKSSVAARLAAAFDWPYYKVDDHEREHSERSSPERHPVMTRYAAMGWNEIWSRPVALQVEEEFDYYRERFEMIVQDLQRYDLERPLILEGAAYLPELVQQAGARRERVLLGAVIFGVLTVGLAFILIGWGFAADEDKAADTGRVQRLRGTGIAAQRVRRCWK